MRDYSQPSFYRFSEDSTLLANYIIEKYKNKKICRYLDACAGCAIIGIEVIDSVDVSELLICEAQQEFVYHIEENLRMYSNTDNISLYNQRIESLAIEKVDLISINPPYFSKDASRSSPDENKNICRIYEEGALASIFRKSISLLKDNGEILFVIRDDDQALAEIQKGFTGHVVERVLRKNNISIFRAKLNK